MNHGGSSYSLARHALSYHLRDAIEALIYNTDADFFSRRYEPARNRYLESTALGYLTNALPGCMSLHNLYYTVVEDGVEKRCELDGLMLFDTTLILVEAKAGTLSAPARRGSISRIRKDISRLIEKPFDQCLRAHGYIKDSNPCVFYDKRKKEICRIDPSSVANMFLITVTLDSLGPISGNLNTVRSLGLASGNEWFWSVGIHDLRIISELSEFPSQLLHYLQRRIRANTQPAIKSIDEVELFGVYLTDGLFFEDWELKDMNRIFFTGYTDPIDDYYYRSEAGQEIAKPMQDLPLSFRQLILMIEGTKREGYSEVNVALLNMDGESREEFTKQLDQRVADVRETGKSRDFTMLFEGPSRGVSAVIVPTISDRQIETARDYCTKKQSEYSIRTWFCIMIGVKDKDARVHFFIRK